ncbi:MAG: methylmalonyl-CoA mutase family protein [Verrucomicrobiota bacterium]
MSENLIDPPATSKNDSLLDGFPAIDFETWKKKAETDLRGVPFDKKLLTRTPEGITLQPLYTPSDTEALEAVTSLPGFAPYVRGASAAVHSRQSWEIVQEYRGPDILEANRAILQDLNQGVTGLHLVPDEPTQAGRDADLSVSGIVGRCGLNLATFHDLENLLRGVELGAVDLSIECGASPLPIAAALQALCEKRGTDPATLRGALKADSIAFALHYGQLPVPRDVLYDQLANVTQWAESLGIEGLDTVAVEAGLWLEAGSTAVQELAYALGAAVEHLRELQARGVPTEAAAKRVRFTFSVGPNFYLEIAKLRAARMLWARLFEDGAAPRCHLHARTALYNKTRYDAHTNLIRTTPEAMAAVLGGADSLLVLPFEEGLEPADDFSRRLARNTQLILRQECHFGRVIDPAGGSWAVESLTHQLAAKAWELFRSVEGEGGLWRALQGGGPQTASAKAATDKLLKVAQRRLSLVGVNQYPNPREEHPDPVRVTSGKFGRLRQTRVRQYKGSRASGAVQSKLMQLARRRQDPVRPAAEALKAGATLGEVFQDLYNESRGETITPVCAHRASNFFERARHEVDHYAVRRRKRPLVFLANMGPVGQHKLRADFTAAFFQTVGFEVESPKGFETPEAAAEAAVKSGAPVVAICSTDATYPEIVPALAEQIKRRRPKTTVALAGYPQEHLEAFRKAGVDEFVHIKANALETLIRILIKIGVLHEDFTQLRQH